MGRENMDHGHRRRRRAYRVLVALALSCGSVSAASAQLPGYNGHDQSERVWKRMDNCKRQAWKQHPDYTREDSLKRDEVVRHCLEANNEPPVSPLTQPAPRERSGSSR
jgi:hypothetical protein